MAKPRRSRRTLTLVVLVLLSLTIISIDESSHTHYITAGLRSMASGVFSPLRSGANNILRPIGDFVAGALDYGSLQKENQKLQATIGQMKLQSSEAAFQAQQLREITALEHLPFLGSLPVVTAQTTAIDVSNFSADIVIDKGRNQGVAYGMPVVASGGLVGQVMQANHNSAVVRLLTDGQSKIGVTFGKQYLATVNGQGPGNPLTADFVAPRTPLRRAEVMFTNSLAGGEYPPGIPVGFVTRYRTPQGSSQMSISLEPMANLNTLTYVDVVQWEPAP